MSLGDFVRALETILCKGLGLLKPGNLTQKALIFICNNRHCVIGFEE